MPNKKVYFTYAYCFSCEKKTVQCESRSKEMRNGALMSRGYCEQCDTKTSVFLK